MNPPRLTSDETRRANRAEAENARLRHELAGARAVIAPPPHQKGHPMNRWAKTVRVGAYFHNPDMTFEQRRDGIVSVFERSGWGVTNDYVGDLVSELGEAEDTEHFDSVWNAIYDEADVDRVWIDTLGGK